MTLLTDASVRAARTEVIMRAGENISKSRERKSNKEWCSWRRRFEKTSRLADLRERNVKAKGRKGAGAEVPRDFSPFFYTGSWRSVSLIRVGKPSENGLAPNALPQRPWRSCMRLRGSSTRCDDHTSPSTAEHDHGPGSRGGSDHRWVGSVARLLWSSCSLWKTTRAIMTLVRQCHHKVMLPTCLCPPSVPLSDYGNACEQVGIAISNQYVLGMTPSQVG